MRYKPPQGYYYLIEPLDEQTQLKGVAPLCLGEGIYKEVRSPGIDTSRGLTMADEICTPEEVNINVENTNTEQLAPRTKKKEQRTSRQSKTKVSDPTHAPFPPIDLPKTPILPLPGTNACLKSHLYP